ncbi:tyrosine-type recombinase/integrase [Paraburkholderia mimosarum]|uniref:tyrosine-type recombinase/integrase n=1 Tax=Paraburkholderia mimosarum TaxID=312026 RepID=UPI00048A3835|nr:site-specific integrase [Paraburkholderia mimosarum]
MDNETNWNLRPGTAYRRWQETEAKGADRRPFSPRSIVQHVSMLDRFVRHIAPRGATMTNFGGDHIESFFSELGARSAAGTSTALRYARLLDRLCRHLIDIGARSDNPASHYVRTTGWPRGEPMPLFLDEAADLRLQGHVRAPAGSDAREIRNRATVALLLGSGITSAEIRAARRTDLVLDGPRPHLRVARHGARDERKVSLPPFATEPLTTWLEQTQGVNEDEMLFPMNAATGSFCEETLWRAVREALEAIGFTGPDMSPRVLRNSYARRLLIAGRSNHEVSTLLGLRSQRTVVRIRATIPPSQATVVPGGA